MSHLSILPTVLKDADVLENSLISLGYAPRRLACLQGFAAEREAVELALDLDEGLSLGWSRQKDGCLALVGDLQRLSRHRELPDLLARITRAYAAHQALAEAGRCLPDAVLSVGD